MSDSWCRTKMIVTSEAGASVHVTVLRHVEVVGCLACAMHEGRAMRSRALRGIVLMFAVPLLVGAEKQSGCGTDDMTTEDVVDENPTITVCAEQTIRIPQDVALGEPFFLDGCLPDISGNLPPTRFFDDPLICEDYEGKYDKVCNTGETDLPYGMSAELVWPTDGSAGRMMEFVVHPWILLPVADPLVELTLRQRTSSWVKKLQVDLTYAENYWKPLVQATRIDIQPPAPLSSGDTVPLYSVIRYEVVTPPGHRGPRAPVHRWTGFGREFRMGEDGTFQYAPTDRNSEPIHFAIMTKSGPIGANVHINDPDEVWNEFILESSERISPELNLHLTVEEPFLFELINPSVAANGGVLYKAPGSGGADRFEAVSVIDGVEIEDWDWQVATAPSLEGPFELEAEATSPAGPGTFPNGSRLGVNPSRAGWVEVTLTVTDANGAQHTARHVFPTEPEW